MKKYYYSDGVSELGPFTLDELKAEGITKDNLVWFAPMNEWEPAGSIDELSSLFSEFDLSKPSVPENKVAQPEKVVKPAVASVSSSNLLDDVTVPEKPTNYLWQSIVVAIICCSIFTLPFSIAGIVNATKVNPAYERGDYEVAQRASKMAKQWTTVAFIIGCVIFVFAFLLGFLGAM